MVVILGARIKVDIARARASISRDGKNADLFWRSFATFCLFSHLQDKTGAVIYYEQLGKVDDEALKRVGLDSKQMLWHYMYQVTLHVSGITTCVG